MQSPVDTVLHREIDVAALADGRAYANEGRVKSWALSSARQKLTAYVEGSKLYKVEAALTWSSAGVLTNLSGFCSCAQAFQCKHLAAAMFVTQAGGALREEFTRNTRTSWSHPDFEVETAQSIASPLSPELGIWLTDYQRHYAKRLQNGSKDLDPKASKPNTYPPKVKDRIWYIVKQDSDALSIEALKVSVRKDGSLSPDSVQPYDFRGAIHRSPPRFVLPIDQRIFRLLAVLPRDGLMNRSIVTDDEEGQMLFRLVLESDRARWDNAYGLALHAGDPCAGEVAWRDFGDTQQLMVKVTEQRSDKTENDNNSNNGNNSNNNTADSQPCWVKALPLVPPWYLNTETGRCGPLETNLPPLKLKWLASAPAVPATQTERVLAAMSSANIDVPRPRPVAQERITDIEPVPVLKLGVIRAREHLDQDFYVAYHRPFNGPSYRPSNRPFQRHEIAPMLRLSFDYDGHRVAADTSDTITRPTQNGTLEIIERNATLEGIIFRKLLDRVDDYAFRPAGLFKDGVDMANHKEHDLVFWPFDGLNPMTEQGGGHELLDFMADVVPALKAQGWIIKIDAAWPCTLHEGEGQIQGGIKEQIKAQDREQANEQKNEADNAWFSLGLNFEVNGQEFDLLPVLANLVQSIPENVLEDDRKLQDRVKDARFVTKLKDGSYARLPLAPLMPALRVIRDLNKKMHAAQAGTMHDLAQALAGCGIAFDADERLMALGKRLRALAERQSVGAAMASEVASTVAGGAANDVSDPFCLPTLPDTFKGDLRHYQKTGMAWMLALSDTGFGGILADDMGLGKTVQTLAFLAARQHKQALDPIDVDGLSDSSTVSDGGSCGKTSKATKTVKAVKGAKITKTTKATKSTKAMAAAASVANTASVADPVAARTCAPTQHLPCLLVVPTSLVSNWLREAAHFVPTLRVLALHGPDRKQHFAAISQQDLVITTYPLLHRDHEALFAQDYDTVILDEAQNVKNPTSQAAKLIRDVSARQRLALTGTPMENNLEELWCIFDWLIPGLLGNRKSFSEKFRKPIEKDKNVTRQMVLSKRIAPFVLRRTKDQVVTDLPPRTEIVETVELAGPQRALYETVRATMHERVRQALSKKGLASSKITVLDALLKLRQACCDPQLVKLASAESISESAKRSRLMEMLESLTLEGRRVLVFSQFVEMLTLIESDIKAQGWDYLMLTGQSKRRGELVETFQTGKANIFLISLKAGGVGLNLTAADTVVLYDPWWNPAIERQAMDRAHRIGQDKPVFVHRLIAQGTVETRIAEMQARKQALMDSVFDPDATGAMDMSEDDILSLFAPIGD